MASRRPKVPYRSFHEVRLPRRLRRQIKRRSNRYADKVYGPQIAALRGQKRAVRRQYRQDVAANRASIDMTQDALKDVPLKGLHGRYRRQVAQELAASSADVARSLPLLNSEAAATRSEAMLGVRQDIVDTKVDEAQLAARTAYQLMKEARSDAAAKLKARHQHAVDNRQAKRQRKGELQTAVRIANNLFLQTPDEFRPWGSATINGFRDDDGNKQPPVSQTEWWRRFEEEVRRQSDVSGRSAREAIKVLRRQLNRAIRHPGSKRAFKYEVPFGGGMMWPGP